MRGVLLGSLKRDGLFRWSSFVLSLSRPGSDEVDTLRGMKKVSSAQRLSWNTIISILKRHKLLGSSS